MRRPIARGLAPALAGLALACALLLGAVAGGCVGDYVPGVPAQSGTPQAYDYYPFAAQGYVIRWTPGSTIRLWLPNCTTTFVPGCQTTFFQAVLDGIRAWDPVHTLLGITVELCTVVPGLPPCEADDVRVIWDDGTGSSGYTIAPGVIGFAAIARQPATLTRFIVMTTQCNICGYTPHSDADIQAIAAHEWGHMLGVWNHSFDPADLMYPYKTAQPGLTVRDVYTMRKAYSQPAALNMSALPPNAWTQSGAALAAGSADPPYLIRFQHSYGEVPTTTLDFNPPGE